MAHIVVQILPRRLQNRHSTLRPWLHICNQRLQSAFSLLVAACDYIKMNTLEKLCNSLKHDQFEVDVDKEVSKRARIAVRRILVIR